MSQKLILQAALNALLQSVFVILGLHDVTESEYFGNVRHTALAVSIGAPPIKPPV